MGDVFLYLLILFFVVLRWISHCLCVRIWQTKWLWTISSRRPMMHSNNNNKKILVANISLNFSNGKVMVSKRGGKKTDITRQAQNNSFTLTSLTFLRFPVKWNPADIHFASPAIVKSKRPAYPSCWAVWARYPGGFLPLAHHSLPALLLLCPWQVVLRVEAARRGVWDLIRWGREALSKQGSEEEEEGEGGKNEGRRRGGHGVGFRPFRVNGIRRGRERDICAC